jgi:hypothetical protein
MESMEIERAPIMSPNLLGRLRSLEDHIGLIHAEVARILGRGGREIPVLTANVTRDGSPRDGGQLDRYLIFIRTVSRVSI